MWDTCLLNVLWVLTTGSEEALGHLQCFGTAAVNGSGTCPKGSPPSTSLIIVCLKKHGLSSAWS